MGAMNPVSIEPEQKHLEGAKMILKREQLEEITSSEHVYWNSIGVTLSDVEELLGTPLLEKGRVENVTTDKVEMHQGLWKLSPDTYYVKFNESIELVNNMVGLLLPHVNLIRAGATIYPRLVDNMEDGQVRAVMRVNNRVQMAPDTPVGTVVVWDE